MITINRGLDLPISGAPEQTIDIQKPVQQVALIAADYPDLQPRILVQVGEKVTCGDSLFVDKGNPEIIFTAPGGGVVSAIHRGARRALQSVVIDLAEKEESRVFFSPSQTVPEVPFVRQFLQQSGLWTAFRTRPFGKVPIATTTPILIFVTAIDTQPLAPDPRTVIAGQENNFIHGLKILQQIAPVVLCQGEGTLFPGSDLNGVRVEIFRGPHPAGLPGTHIHFVSPVSAKKTVWHIGYQDVAAFGQFFMTGQLPTTRIVSLAGPVAKTSRLIKTRLGASLLTLTAGELLAGENRVISGSVLGGRTAKNTVAFLGRYHQQISCLAEGRDRQMLHYLRPGFDKHSALNVFVSKLLPKKSFALTTTTNGGARAIVSVGNYESVMPLDILATPLLRALVVGDTEMAQKLGCLELDEEDLALCSYVCAGKYEYGPILRDNLRRIEKEG